MVYSRQIKYSIMKECDRAFQNSILKKDEFGELFRKIDVNGVFIVAYHAYVIGYAVLYANNLSENEGYLTLIAVLPEYQGKNIGLDLLLACCDIAHSRGMMRLRLEVKKDNEKAIRFYLKNGFCFDGHCSDQSEYMVKLLDS